MRKRLYRSPPFPNFAIMVSGGCIMTRLFTIAIILTSLAWSAFAQDWYHDRDERFRGDRWRPHLFEYVRTDLQHVWSGKSSDQERTRLQKTEEELTKMQGDL